MKRLARNTTVFALVACLAFLGCSDRATAPSLDGPQSPSAVENQPLETISLAKRKLPGGIGIIKEMGINPLDGATIVFTDPSDGTLVTYCGMQFVEHNATIIQLQGAVGGNITPVIVHIIIATLPTFLVPPGGRFRIETPSSFHCSETQEALLSFQMSGLPLQGR